MTNQDFTTGVDMTGINPVSGADINNVIELAVPTADVDDSVGKGLLLTTTDSALNVPVVPDASVTTKWKRYTWFRRPIGNGTSKAYTWNDNATSNTTFLKWVELNISEEQIAALTAVVNNALSTSQAAVTTAGLAVTTANDAVNSASTANDTADAAQIAATEAQTTADAATTTANTAVTTANTAATSAAAAATMASQSLALVGADAYGQWIELKGNGVDNGPSASGANSRVLTSEIKALSGVTLTGAGRLTLIVGKYWIDAIIITYAVDSQSIIWDNTNAVILLFGTPQDNAVAPSVHSHVRGFIDVIGTPIDIELRSYCGSINANGLGKAVNLGHGEVYCDVTIKRLG